MSDTIGDRIEARGITRVCHFTPSRSLSHILADGAGILPTKQLSEDERELYNPTDLKRLDGHTDHVCCSIEYPNGWYMAKAQSAELLFPDWVVLFIRPTILSRPGTLFAPRNAAASSGAYLRPELTGFDAMYAPSVVGAYNRVFRRGETHLACSPTDDQAEVLIPGRIAVEDIIGIGVRSTEQGAIERVRLSYCDIPGADLNFIVAPTLFNKDAQSRSIRNGIRPVESPLPE